MTGDHPCRLVLTAHKGGVGKTTLAVNLAGAFAEAGRRTLLVDVDPQGAAGAGLGFLDVSKPSLAEVLLVGANPSEAIVASAVEGLDLLPADLDLAGAEINLPQRSGWQTHLRDILASIDADYDIVLLDSAPGLGVLPFAALVAGDWALIAATPAYYTVRSISHVLDTVTQARRFNPGLQVLGIVPSIVGTRTLLRDESLDVIEARWPGWSLPGLARRVALEEAAVAGLPITTYVPTSSSATAVRTLAQEVLARAASQA